MSYHSNARSASRLLTSTLVGAFIAGGMAGSALAADLAAPPVVPVAPPVTDFFSTMTHTEQLEAGFSINPDRPADHNNFGQENADKPNEFQFNQLLITFARPVDETKAYDVGFNLQGLFGADARYDPTLGLLDYTLQGRQQFIMTQANIVIHTPFLLNGSIDTKLGLYPGAMGYETTDPSTRPFYTYSYITNYLLPFQHVGGLATWHVNPTIDIYAGIDAGNEVTPGPFDNNREPAGYAGIGLNNLLDNKLTILAVTRIGPEDAVRGVGPVANSALRYYNDITATYKATDKWTFVGEANYYHDDIFGTAYGLAGYASYAFNEEVTLNTRGEIYRDTTGLNTLAWLTPLAFTNGLAGYTDPNIVGAAPTTYGEITVGISYKPNFINKAQDVAKVTIRPEVRYDASLNNTTPFDGNAAGVGTKSGQFLFSTDLIVAF